MKYLYIQKLQNRKYLLYLVSGAVSILVLIVLRVRLALAFSPHICLVPHALLVPNKMA